jgi:hypothetical protein
MRIEAPDADLGARADLVDRGGVITALGEHSFGRADDLLELFLWLSPGFSALLWGS